MHFVAYLLLCELTSIGTLQLGITRGMCWVVYSSREDTDLMPPGVTNLKLLETNFLVSSHLEHCVSQECTIQLFTLRWPKALCPVLPSDHWGSEDSLRATVSLHILSALWLHSSTLFKASENYLFLPGQPCI